MVIVYLEEKQLRGDLLTMAQFKKLLSLMCNINFLMKK